MAVPDVIKRKKYPKAALALSTVAVSHRFTSLECALKINRLKEHLSAGRLGILYSQQRRRIVPFPRECGVLRSMR